jgi:hypothetical protein
MRHLAPEEKEIRRKHVAGLYSGLILVAAKRQVRALTVAEGVRQSEEALFSLHGGSGHVVAGGLWSFLGGVFC